MKPVVIIEVEREGYSVDQCYRTMTVGELKESLNQFEENAPIYFSHDNGYTYGSLREENIDVRYEGDEDEEDNDEEYNEEEE